MDICGTSADFRLPLRRSTDPGLRKVGSSRIGRRRRRRPRVVEPVQERDDALVLVRVADVELVVVSVHGGAQREEELAGDARPHVSPHASKGAGGARLPVAQAAVSAELGVGVREISVCRRSALERALLVLYLLYDSQ